MRLIDIRMIKGGEKRYVHEKAAWDSAMYTWNQLYYCKRDDFVFNPRTGETTQPDNLKEFLYSK
jgi:hypothetical protein